MTEQPKQILLATDMSARSDRALERAKALVAQWQATLSVVCAVETREAREEIMPSWYTHDNALDMYKKYVAKDLARDGLQNATLHIDTGNPAEFVLSVSRNEKSDLIITGIARDEPLGLIQVGRMASHLIRHAHAPVLVVKKRVRDSYRNIVVAVDISETSEMSKLALDKACTLFPHQPITVFHACHGNYADQLGDKDTYIKTMCDSARQDIETFLQENLDEARRQQVTIYVEHGFPADRLTQYVMDHDVDLVVAGTHARTGLSSLFSGSVTDTILSVVPTDILLIRAP